jgi:CDP-paratose 2-epimerase
MDYERALITGGAGFIGCNLSDALLTDGLDVIIFDNLSRPGTSSNLEWLKQRQGKALKFIQGDIRDAESLSKAMDGAQVVYHLAAQTAVTRSVVNPREDFDINALGTFNVLEAARNQKEQPAVLFASTNKVYGSMADAQVHEGPTRYSLPEYPDGVDENRTIDFHSPYGCSKGAADQYVRDYSRIYGIRTVVARQSCIYGYRQFGVEDQGWIAWFIIAALLDRPISIYGDGKQVRDILFIEDLIAFYKTAIQKIDSTSGDIFNIGGGPKNTISVWAEFHPMLESLLKRPIPVKYGDWRPGDQPVYISDIRKAERELGWQPKVSVRQGIERLFEWVNDNKSLFSHF